MRTLICKGELISGTGVARVVRDEEAYRGKGSTDVIWVGGYEHQYVGETARIIWEEWKRDARADAMMRRLTSMHMDRLSRKAVGEGSGDMLADGASAVGEGSDAVG